MYLHITFNDGANPYVFYPRNSANQADEKQQILKELHRWKGGNSYPNFTGCNVTIFLKDYFITWNPYSCTWDLYRRDNNGCCYGEYKTAARAINATFNRGTKQ